uniref:Uncharacterized protein n=1 Tax=Vitrella brassicaformis TaxID=1169539 RepID=A0A7S1K667_9ALVE|mmetsp:Transcript_39703/g.99380  ORF Transcript_39703/g.99380 Transcript_39703/m.99380 type:complete len:106 (+) Transcript_39703:42-359(+)
MRLFLLLGFLSILPRIHSFLPSMDAAVRAVVRSHGKQPPSDKRTQWEDDASLPLADRLARSEKRERASLEHIRTLQEQLNDLKTQLQRLQEERDLRAPSMGELMR